MYTLSRIVLTLAIGMMCYCVLVLGIILFPWSVIGLVLAFVRLVHNRVPKLTAHGTARLAEESDLREAGMIGADQGLILGWLPVRPNGRFLRAIARVFNLRISAEEACRRFLEVFRKRPSQEKGELVRHPQAVHTAVFAPTRSGKGVSCILPWIYTTEASFVCIDPKGENALLTAEHLGRRGFEIVILDPYKVVTS